MTDKEKSSNIYLEWTKTLSTAVASILVPLAVAVVGNSLTQAINKREVEQNFVELAIEILQAEPSDETENLRVWATKIIDKYSGVQMSAEAVAELQKVPLRPLSLGSRVLSLGDSGSDVRELQTILSNRFGYATVVDGSFGPQLESIIREIQTNNGQTADGRVGAATLHMILKSSNSPETSE